MMAVVITAAMIILNPAAVMAEPAGAAGAGGISSESLEYTGDIGGIQAGDPQDTEEAEETSGQPVYDGAEASLSSYSEEESAGYSGFDGDEIVSDEAPDNDELLEGYLNRQFEEQIKENGAGDSDGEEDLVSSRRLFAAIPRRNFLTVSDAGIYDGIAAYIPETAAGNISSTAFSVSGSFIYTAEELGVETITVSNNKLSDDAKKGLSKRVGKVIDALLADYPYDLFWYDKTKGTGYTYSFGILNGGKRLRLSRLVFSMRVAEEYAVDGALGTMNVDTAKIHAINNTVSSAQAVVEEAKASAGTDYEKLVYFRDWICNEVSYNYGAAGNSGVPYGNPWQLIWVFDGDPETKVVCEGYSKAFKWLCDLSVFDDNKIGCYLMTGKMNGGGHMWNHVTMGDSKYYMVDVTNYDGHPERPRLFLGGYDSYSDPAYTYHGLRYIFDDDAKGIYTAELELSDTDYVSEPYDKYTVTFDNGDTGAVENDQVVKAGTLATRPDEPTETGYSFGGWFKDPEYRESWDFDNDAVTSDTTIYVKWTKNVYLVSFNSVGGSSVSGQQIEYNSTAEEPLSPDREGYVFEGWFTDPEYGSQYDFATPVTGDMTLYAKWSVKTYNVLFDSNGGSDVTGQTVEHGDKAARPYPSPQKEGYFFEQWYSDKELNTIYDFRTPVKSDLVLYAKWNRIAYTVSFDTCSEVRVESQKVAAGGIADLPYPLPEKSGYTIKRWYTEIGLINEFDFNTRISEDLHLYGKWEKKKYTVSFDSMGGSQVPDETVEYEDRASEPIAPSKEGYAFLHWYSDKNCTLEWDFDNTPVTRDVILYAKWTVDDDHNWGDVDEGVRARNGIKTPGDIPKNELWLDGIADVVYTASAQTFPELKVFYGSTLLELNTDYTVSYRNNVNAGENAKVVINGKGRYSGKKEERFRISPRDINDKAVAVGGTNTVSGEKPAPVITYNGTRLDAKQYELDASDNLTEDRKITIAGIGNFTGTRTEEFKTVPKSALKKMNVAIKKGTAFTYDGQTHQLTTEQLIVTDAASKEALKENTDYLVTYSADTTDAGTVKVTVTGTGNYTGYSKKSYKINPARDAVISVSLPEGKKYEFMSTGVTPSVSVSAVLYGGERRELVCGRDYRLSYSRNKKVGNNAVVKVAFIGNYKGAPAQNETFTIEQAELSDSTAYVQTAQKLVYNEKKPKFSAYKNTPYVTLGGILLKGSEYSVKYFRDGVELEKNSIVTPDGTGRTEITVKIYPKSLNYKGGSEPVTGSYVIEKPAAGMTDLGKAKVRVTDKKSTTSAKIYYTGKEIRFDSKDDKRQGDIQISIGDRVYWSSDPEFDRNFVVEYINNIEKGTARVIITPREGNGQYCGYKTQTFSIKAAGIK